MTTVASQTCAVILSGGEGRRMDFRDKGLQLLDGRPLLEHVIERLSPQADRLKISANRNLEQYRKYGYEVFSDLTRGHQGPLQGILSAFHHTDSEYLLLCPCDTPYIPLDMGARLFEAITTQNRQLAIISTRERTHPICSLLHRSLEPSLTNYLSQGKRRVLEWMEGEKPAHCLFEDEHAFSNFNRLADLHPESYPEAGIARQIAEKPHPTV